MIADADELGAGAYDYLFYSGYVALAYWWARSVVAAERSTRSAAFKAANHVTKLDFINNRLVPNAIEPRAWITVRQPPTSWSIGASARPTMNIEAKIAPGLIEAVIANKAPMPSASDCSSSRVNFE